MNLRITEALLPAAAMAVLALQWSGAARADEHGRGEVRGHEHAARGMVLDSRHDHGRYYPPVGAGYRVLPEGYRPYYYRGSRYYFHGGVWYAPGGPGFVVVRPPIGLVVSILPPYYSTLWIGGLPYYYADNIYYTWSPADNGYRVVNPPENADQAAEAPLPPTVASHDDLIVYPKNGQSKEQQSADDYECHSWAKSQTGFDPTQPSGGPGVGADQRSNYNRAKGACLEARGYQVK